VTAGGVALTIVIPAYNEEARLGRSLDTLIAHLQARAESWEILVVDDGSTDGTARVAGSRAAVRVVRLPSNRGKGAAVRAGLAESAGERVLFSDADLSTPPEELAKLTEALDKGADLAMGSRGLPGSDIVVRQAWYREHMGKTFNLILRAITGIPFRDTQCGFKLMRGEVARVLAGELREDGFAFDVELVLRANRNGFVVREIPVVWKNVEGSRVDPLSDSVRMLMALPRITGEVGRYRAD
jgi:dolichyl-phosphate beta-glucosyltransferase